MKKHGIVDALYLSFFSRDLYRDVATQWKGFGLVYLIAVLALCTIPGVLRMQAELNAWQVDQAPSYIRQVPRVTITKGQLSVDAAEPYRIMNEKTGEPVVIIDTTGGTTSLDGSKAFALFTKSTLVIKKSEQESRTFNLSDLGGETIIIDRASAYDLLDSFTDAFPIVIYPFVLILSSVLWSVLACVNTLVCSLYARRLSLSLSNSAVMRISVMALTPALLISAVLTTTGITVPYWWTICVLGSAGYALYGIQANSRSQPQDLSDNKIVGP